MCNTVALAGVKGIESSWLASFINLFGISNKALLSLKFENN